GAGRRAVDIQKTININAPVEEVFKFWENYENFPRFMSNVREVIDKGDGRSHWVVAGPAGVPVEWDAVVTKRVPNEVFAWKTVPGSVVANAGMVIFRRNDDGTTTVDIKLSYNPPAGAVGHAVATLFGSDPKTEMDQDLMRMKTMIETGVAPRDSAQPSAREASTRNP
ncbi:MAG TPA: SRPBCC family protein, partial [Blastocatellia bacterium]|nr:SRPBCC family protein [Blastocatellia bacterium]